jgi:hypothetical protein
MTLVRRGPRRTPKQAVAAVWTGPTLVARLRRTDCLSVEDRGDPVRPNLLPQDAYAGALGGNACMVYDPRAAPSACSDESVGSNSSVGGTPRKTSHARGLHAVPHILDDHPIFAEQARRRFRFSSMEKPSDSSRSARQPDCGPDGYHGRHERDHRCPDHAR